MRTWKTTAKGIMMHVGTSDVAIYLDRDLRNVHPSRLDEAIAFKIEYDKSGIQMSDEKWKHYTYRFTYRYMGKTFSTLWHCGESYGHPKAFDGLIAAFNDAESAEFESLSSWADAFGYEMDYAKAKKIYHMCERVNVRLHNFLGDSFMTWRKALDTHM